MPPIKGRMMSRMGGLVPSVQRDTKEVRNVKKVTLPRRKLKSSPIKTEGNLPLNITEDEKLMKLRMPSDIVRILPSVKKYKGGKDFVDLTDNVSLSGESSKSDLIIDEDRSSITSGPSLNTHVIGCKKGRGAQNKYVMKLIAEERFCSMIWDVSISPIGEIFVSCCEGIFICDSDLERKSKLDKVVLPGGVDFLPDGQIVAICRNSDTVNFFSKDGIFIKSFSAGFSPMGIIVNGKEKIIVTDPGEKSVHIYDTKGNELQKIPTIGNGYKFQWPLYVSQVDEQSFVISDCHSQKVHKFMNNGRFISTYKLKTVGGNEVLRPHGLCTYQEQDLFVIDTSLDTIEVFTWDDTFIQTLIPHDEGITLKPKCVRLNKEASLMVIGGRMGVVRVYEFLENKLNGNHKNSAFRVKQEIPIIPVIKKEVKSEPQSVNSGDVIILE